MQSLKLFVCLLLSPAFEASPAAVGEVVQNRKINKIINVALCWAKTSGSVKIENQVFNSRVAVFESSLRGAGNITEAPPVADEARRCWRKTRSIAPAPRAIGDYVLRGLNGLRSKTHEPALVQAPARLRANVPSNRLRAASYVLRRGVAGVSGRSPEFAFLLQAFSFSNKKKMPKRGKCKSLIMVGREGNKPGINKSKLLYRLLLIADSRKGCSFY